MATPEEIKADMDKKFGGKETPQPSEAERAAEAEKITAAAEAAKAEEAKKAGKEVSFDPDDLLDEPEKKDEPLVELSDDEVKKLGAKAAEAFKHQRQVIGELKTELKELREKGGGEPSEREKELAKKLAQYNAAEDPDFQKTYVEPVNAAWRDIEGTLKTLSVPAADILKLKSADLAQRMTLMPTIFKGKEAAIGYLSPMFAELDRKVTSAKAAYSTADESLKKARGDKSKGNEAAISSVADGVVLELAKQHKALVREDAKPEKNARIDADVAEAKKLAAKIGGDPKLSFETALKAVLGSRYAKHYASTMAQLSESEKKRIASLRGRASVGGNGSSKPSGDSSKLDFTKVKHHEHGKAMFEDMQRKLGHG